MTDNRLSEPGIPEKILTLIKVWVHNLLTILIQMTCNTSISTNIEAYYRIMKLVFFASLIKIDKYEDGSPKLGIEQETFLILNDFKAFYAGN